MVFHLVTCLSICLLLTGCINPRTSSAEAPLADIGEPVVLVFIYDAPFYEVFMAQYNPSLKRVEPKRQIGTSQSAEGMAKLISDSDERGDRFGRIWTINVPIISKMSQTVPDRVRYICITPIPEDVQVYRPFHLR